MRRSSLFALSVGIAASLACAAGTECGEGTELVDGECVAAEADTEPEETDTVPEETDTEDTEPVDTDTSDEVPTILSFTSEGEITQGGTVTFVALLEDPQGTDDVALGALVTTGGETVGVFADGGSGRWTISLGWADLQTMGAIDFASEEQRTFVAHFVDRSAHIVEQSATLRLHCNGTAACSGVCTDTLNDADNCGTCGNTCDLCSTGQCFSYECIEQSASVDNCDQACASIGRTCGGDVCSGGSTTGYMIGDGTCDSFTVYRLVDECSTTFTDGYDLHAKCCCAG
ncbi:MAG: hypothetical protein Q8P41_24720 [Pseudomonadota bacterium]|nr:hypothetical protein [Pseudomonadota bacterium]